MLLHWLHGWVHQLVSLFEGPGHFRFFLQPLIALILGLRDGRRDAHANKPPFLWSVILDPGNRQTSWQSAVATLGKTFVFATLLDSVLQLVSLHTLRPGYAVLTGCLLVALPYALVRAITTRVSAMIEHRRAAAH
jgi:hypothetical protein